jgi:molecular chaperone GrpE
MNHKPEHELEKQEQTPEPAPSEAEGAGVNSAAEPVAGETDLQQVQAALEAAQAAAAEHLDKFMRAKAEIENIRRRADTDMTNARKFAVERFAGELLAVRDSLELARAVDLEQDNNDALAKMHEGLDLTLQLLDSVFEKFSITVIDPQGEKFDPQLQQAVSMAESEEVPDNHVVTVVQKGYCLYNRLLRPAMVIVAKGKNGGAPTDEGKKPKEST